MMHAAFYSDAHFGNVITDGRRSLRSVSTESPELPSDPRQPRASFYYRLHTGTCP